MRSTSDYPPPVSLSPPSLVGLPEQEDVFAVEHLSRLCDGLAQQRPNNLRDLLNTLALIAPLLNAIPNVVFFIKDAQARYLLANLTLARRCGFKTVTPLLGKTSADVSPQLGSGYTEQDLRVLRHGVLIQDQLEMHLYNGRETGWCLTQKLALYDAQGKSSVWRVFLTICRRPEPITRPTSGWRRSTCISAATTPDRSRLKS